MEIDGGIRGEMDDSQTVTKPESAGQANLMHLFKDALKADGSVDMRSTYGRSIRAIKDLLQEDPETTMVEIVQSMIAIDLTLLKAVESYALADPDRLFQEGELSELITKNLFKIQVEIRNNLKVLKQLRKKHRGTGDSKRNLSDLSFD